MNKSTVTTLNDVIQQLYILTNAVLSNKNTLTLDECAAYTGLSPSHIYKLTSAGEIPHYKPRGKMIYFNRAELDQWLLQNRVSTRVEIEQQAVDHMAKGVRQ